MKRTLTTGRGVARVGDEKERLAELEACAAEELDEAGPFRPDARLRLALGRAHQPILDRLMA
jgi:hypothetical protein